MNKYQSAINELRYALIPDSQCDYTLEEKKMLVNIMQELLDNYNKVRTTANCLVNHLMKDSTSSTEYMLKIIEGKDNE